MGETIIHLDGEFVNFLRGRAEGVAHTAADKAEHA